MRLTTSMVVALAALLCSTDQTSAQFLQRVDRIERMPRIGASTIELRGSPSHRVNGRDMSQVEVPTKAASDAIPQTAPTSSTSVMDGTDAPASVRIAELTSQFTRMNQKLDSISRTLATQVEGNPSRNEKLEGIEQQIATLTKRLEQLNDYATVESANSGLRTFVGESTVANQADSSAAQTLAVVSKLESENAEASPQTCDCPDEKSAKAGTRVSDDSSDTSKGSVEASEGLLERLQRLKAKLNRS